MSADTGSTSNTREGRTEKRRKGNGKWYGNQGKRQRTDSLKTGQKGFLLTCNNREPECVREGYNILNQIFEELYDKPEIEEKQQGDVEDELKNEIAELVKPTKKFQQVYTHCNNVIFIEIPPEADPISMMDRILGNIEENGKQIARFVLRLTPVMTTCKADENSITKSVEQIILNQQNEATYMVLSKVRNNTGLKRTSLIEACAGIVKEKKPGWSVNFDEPQLTLNIDVVQKIACISILKDFTRFKKYNLIEFSNKINDEKKRKTNQIVNIKTEDQNIILKTEDLDLSKSILCENSENDQVKSVEGQAEYGDEGSIKLHVEPNCVEQVTI